MFRKMLGSLVVVSCSFSASAATCPRLVGQWSAGPADAVAGAGSLAYFGSGANFVVADVGNPASPEVIGSLALPAAAARIVLSGHIAYVATGTTGLLVVDVFDPVHPAKVAQLSGPANDVAVSGTNVFVAAGSLLVFDASNPTALTQVGSLAGPGNTPFGYTSVATSSAGIVLAAASIPPAAYGPTGHVDVVSVTDPSHPTVVGFLGSVTGSGYSGPWNVTSAGTLVLVSNASEDMDWLEVWDASNPANPTEMGFYGEQSNQPEPGLGQGRGRVAAAGGLAFLAQSTPGPTQLGVLSLSDPTHPKLVASAPIPAEPSAVAVSGPLVLVADGWGGLLVFDASACGLGGCSLACTPTVPATASSGSPVQFQGAVQPSGCTGTPTYDWDFGDATPHSAAQSPSHTYAAGGSYTWMMAVSLGGGSCSRSGTIHVLSTLPPIGSPGAYAYLIATSAHKRGLNNTSWVTDLTLANPGLADTTARLYFMKGWQDNTVVAAHPVAVPMRQAVALADVLQTTFLESAASGAVLVGADAPLVIGSRTYNDTASGSYGQYVPARPIGEAIASGQTAWLIGLSESSSTSTGFRTNVGLVNVTAEAIDVEVALYRGDGSWLGTQSVHLRSYDFQQLDRIYTLVTTMDVVNGYVVVDTTTQGGRFFAYASVVDNRTGDAIHVPAR